MFKVLQYWVESERAGREGPMRDEAVALARAGSLSRRGAAVKVYCIEVERGSDLFGVPELIADLRPGEPPPSSPEPQNVINFSGWARARSPSLRS
jgi:hypothetical protein